MNELHEFIKSEEQRLRSLYDYKTEREMILSHMCKMTEEVGELSEQVLKSLGFQRKEKMLDANKEDLAEELVDVLITALLLGEALGADIEGAIGKKVEKIKNRLYK